MHAMKNSLGHAQRSISALVHRLFPAPVDHAWFPFEDPSNCLLAERPEFGNLGHRVVLLIGEINRG